jgi:hypothetical protein
VPLHEGREVQTLRRLEHIGGVRKQMEILLSRSSLEPGIFGVMRPVLVWPHGISERLDDAHLEAILVHELCHVRRRDNLAAAMHMLVEAVFWFHPLVWWMGARLVEERECACDEEVVELGSERQVYAEGILKVCKFCVGSPLAFVSGVTGADLKKRIVRIMSEQVARKLGLGRKLLLSVAGLVAVALPFVFGLLHPAQSQAQSQHQSASLKRPAFEVVSIKPDKDAPGSMGGWFSPGTYTERGATVEFLIKEAYGLEDDQLLGAPSWLKSEKYDVQAKVPDDAAKDLQKLTFDQFVAVSNRMVQALLTDRFKLAVHRETRDLPMFALVIAPGTGTS